MGKKHQGRAANVGSPATAGRGDGPAGEASEPAPAPDSVTDEAVGHEPGDAAAAPGDASAAAVLESADEAVQRLAGELAEWKDRCLRTAADLENYRKRAIRERDDAWGRGQAELLRRILEVVDDLARVARLDPEQTSAAALHEGVGLVERKLLKVLEGAGLERLDPAGQPFDPNSHEAVAALAAPSPEADHTVGDVFQHGYRFRGTLLRPARVAVLTWTARAEDEAAS
ncbi:MAG: nucleotide exchange factor GrpE [Gemmatimonadetes bacterium]|nr:nucleotide exchange factor GrpE [Gemmatimonadota bacterium]